MELSHRKCKLSDLKVLARLSRKTFRDAFEKDNDPNDFSNYMKSSFSLEQLKRELQNPATSFYFTKLNDSLVGYFKLNELGAQTDIKENESIELERIYILKDHQGKGIGKWMLDEVKTLAKAKNKRYVWLGVWERNQDAIRFYEREGFTKFGRHPYYIGKDKQMDWLMRFNLVNLES